MRVIAAFSFAALLIAAGPVLAAPAKTASATAPSVRSAAENAVAEVDEQNLTCTEINELREQPDRSLRSKMAGVANDPNHSGDQQKDIFGPTFLTEMKSVGAAPAKVPPGAGPIMRQALNNGPLNVAGARAVQFRLEDELDLAAKQRNCGD